MPQYTIVKMKFKIIWTRKLPRTAGSDAAPDRKSDYISKSYRILLQFEEICRGLLLEIRSQRA